MDIQGSRLTVEHDNDVYRVGFLDRNILEEAYIHMIAAEIGQIIEQTTTPKVLICFNNVEHLSSAALGAMITINNKIKEKGGQLRLSDIAPKVNEIFLITKLNLLFQIHDHAEQAIQSFE